MRLAHKDIDLLQSAILTLHDHRDLPTFRKVVPQVFLSLIPAEYFGLIHMQVDMRRQRVTLSDPWESCPRITLDFLQRGERVGFGHPFTQHTLRTGDRSALKFSDFYSSRQFRSTTVYNEFYRPAGIGRVLGVAAAGGEHGMATLNSIRSWGDRDFSERDRLLMNLLRPHFELARRAVERHDDRREVEPLQDCGLTRRETEVARWLAEGKTNSEIARVLHMRPRTVEKHLERILGKLGVENRTTAAVILARGPRSRT